MKSAFVYLLELVPEDEKYRHLLKKSLELLIKNVASPEDIFLNIYAVEGHKKEDIIKFCKTLGITIFDISEGIPPYNYKKILNQDNTFSYLAFSNHKISNYEKILNIGYDRIIQLDCDIFFLDKTNIFDSLSDNEDTFYALKLPSRYRVGHNSSDIRHCLESRIGSILPIFSFFNNQDKHKEYIYLKKICDTILAYNLDNYESDILNLGYWPNNGITVYNTKFINKHINILKFLNYFVSKDDEILMMLYSFAKNIKYLYLDTDEDLSFNYKELDDSNKKIKILHTTGHQEKLDFISTKLNYI